MLWRKGLVLLTIAAFVATAIVAWTGSTSNTLPGKEEQAKMMSMFLNCVDAQDSGKIEGVVQGCVHSTFTKAKNPRETTMQIETIVAAATDNENVRSACHDVLHQLGSDAWLTFKEEALLGSDVSCGMGYYHGAMREVLKTGSNQMEELTALRQFCVRLASTPENRGTDVSALCYHGIGHALGGVAQDFNEGKHVCNEVAARNSEELKVCVGGFFNEYLINHEVRGVDPAAAASRCDQYRDSDLLVECIKYIMTYAKLTSEVTGEYCKTLSAGLAAEGCWSAVGMIHGGYELFDGKGVEGSNLINDPTMFTSQIEMTCDGDLSTKCSTTIIAESSQRLLNPTAMMKVCAKMIDPRARSGCEIQVRNLAGTQKLD